MNKIWIIVAGVVLAGGLIAAGVFLLPAILAPSSPWDPSFWETDEQVDTGQFTHQQFMISNMQERFELYKTPDGGWLIDSEWKISDSGISFDTKVRYSDTFEPLGLLSKQDVRGTDQEVGVKIDGQEITFWRIQNGQRAEEIVEVDAPFIFLDNNQASHHLILYERIKDLEVGQTRRFSALAPQVKGVYNIIVRREASTTLYSLGSVSEAEFYSLNYEGGITMNMYAVDGKLAGTIEPISTTYFFRHENFPGGFSLEPPE
jgi:hypothetical protein